MDAFSDLIRGVRAHGSLFGSSTLSPPWALHFADGAPLTLCTVLTGAGWIVPEHRPPEPLRARETVAVRGPAASPWPGGPPSGTRRPPEPDFSAITAEELAAYRDAENHFRASSAARALTGDPDPGAAIEWQKVSLSGRELPVRVYRPAAENDGKGAGRAELPLVLHVHGGSFVGTAVQSDWVNSHLAAQLPALVVSVEHRLLDQETPLSAAAADGWDVLRHAARWGIDPARTAVFGESCGGLISALAAIRAREAGLQLTAQVLVNPAVEVTETMFDYASIAEYGYNPTRAMPQLRLFQRLSVPPGTDARALSPLYADNLNGLAPALLVVPTQTRWPITAAATPSDCGRPGHPYGSPNTRARGTRSSAHRVWRRRPGPPGRRSSSSSGSPRRGPREEDNLMTKTRHDRLAIAAMYTGLGLTVIATIVPYLDRATTHLLADHIRAGYPTYSQTRVDSAVTTYLVVLSAIGAFGVVAWLATAWAVKAGNRWARPAAAVMFVLGTSVGLTGLLTKDTPGETGLPPALGWAGIAPCLAGLLAVALLWRRPRPA
ncbi:alpha/beta hydrolase fold domain-containing protein [Streptomyces sp. NBS 14/10]|uniref:alpha/beta hydrolase fold domain-containing protein n=1 Tax=Streptomyces sp. NBS 14/10 TaxID=1945643 RepID=UPI00269B6B03